MESIIAKTTPSNSTMMIHRAIRSARHIRTPPSIGSFPGRLRGFDDGKHAFGPEAGILCQAPLAEAKAVEAEDCQERERRNSHNDRPVSAYKVPGVGEQRARVPARPRRARVQESRQAHPLPEGDGAPRSSPSRVTASPIRSPQAAAQAHIAAGRDPQAGPLCSSLHQARVREDRRRARQRV